MESRSWGWRLGRVTEPALPSRATAICRPFGARRGDPCASRTGSAVCPGHTRSFAGWNHRAYVRAASAREITVFHLECVRMSRGISAFLLLLLSWQSAPTLSGQVPPPPPPTVEEAAEEAGPPYSPRGAFFRSLVLPGWGQAYVDAPARGAVYFSLASGSVWMAWVARRQLSDARREQYWMRQTGEIGPTDETNIAVSREQQFEDWAALSVFLFFFAGADAYVSAYLSDFGERIGVQPGADGQLRIQTMIPVGPRR